MKVLTAEQVRAWDEYTIRMEPISSIQLMERAALACVKWILQHFPTQDHFVVYCGKGNNGGDGLAIARLLAEQGKSVQVHVLEFGYIGTADFQINLVQLHQYPQIRIQFIQSKNHLYPIPEGSVVIDALFGAGLNRVLEGLTADVVENINKTASCTVSIDLPSGLFADRSTSSASVIKANYTLTFECYKLALLFPENDSFVGQVVVLPIGLDPEFLATTTSQFDLLEIETIRSLVKPRSRIAHKGNFGHALLVAGSEGKMGAAVLTANAALRSGLGLLTCHIPRSGYTILQTAVPEAMVTIDKEDQFLSDPGTDLHHYNAIGVGPGIGQHSQTLLLLKKLFTSYKSPLVIDADALNLLSQQPELMELLPEDSILTPHPKEFERLFGPSANDEERIAKAIQRATQLKIIIVLKGYNTLIFNTNGVSYFNSTGNSGMATGGSGDVLTGVLTGLLAQGYSPENAAKIGVFLHGLAGDLAASEYSPQAMVAGDIVRCIGKAWLLLISPDNKEKQSFMR